MKGLNFRHTVTVFMPAAAAAILGPSAAALAFFFVVVTKPSTAGYARGTVVVKLLFSAFIILLTFIARPVLAVKTSAYAAYDEMRYNCHLRAVANLLGNRTNGKNGIIPPNPARRIPSADDLLPALAASNQAPKYNLVIIVLEGIQYRYTSLYDAQNMLTPYMAKIAREGIELANTRSTLTHTTKVLFSLLTGRYPCVSQYLAEADPIIADILSWRTDSAFILSRQHKGEKTLFNYWLCRWEQRVAKKCSRL